ncbi:MAG: chemotaxis protein CheW [Pseudomonadota bacterium]
MPQLATRQRTREVRTLVNDTTQYLTCSVGDETFAIAVAQVREVLDVCPFTKIPNLPPFVRGMIDVRGRAVPVVDLRLKFGLPPAEVTDHTRIIVLEVVIGARSMVMGALTDRVFEVTALDPGEMEPPPDIGMRWRSEIIRGIGRRHHHFVIVLSLNKLFSLEDVTSAGGH